MLAIILFLTSTLLSCSSAHFSIEYPYWRGDSYATQWERPCGGVNQTMSDKNRTAWPINGGSVVFKPSHSWAHTFVNLGLGGDNTTTFNITLVEGFNQTGNGTFCFQTLDIPADVPITNGTNASIQIVQVNEHGSALYNCADIIFIGDVFSEDQRSMVPCRNSTGVGGSFLASEEGGITSSEDSSSTSAAPAPSTSTAGAVARFGALSGLWIGPGLLAYQLM